jgi:hypothetical protein
LIDLCCTLVVTLHLRFGLSRQASNFLLQCLQIIITTCITITFTALREIGAALDIRSPTIKIPKDIHTVYSHLGIEPVITHTACCLKCYTMYPNLNHLPATCSYRISSRSKICNEPLWKKRRTKQGVKWVPQWLDFTQDFGSWLKIFLQRSEIEESLIHTHQNHNFTPNAQMKDLHDSPIWNAINRPTPYNLIFAIYIDWFNLYGVKAAGKYNLPPAIPKPNYL